MRSRPYSLLVYAFVAAAFVSGCDRVGLSERSVPATTKSLQLNGALLLTGSSTLGPLASAIAERFKQLHPGVTIKVELGGSGRGISDVRAAKADIGMVSRVLTVKENDLAGIPIARDGVGIMVHADNPVKTLSTSQVIDIFTGKSRTWRLVGGPAAAITVINRDQTRGAIEVFTHHFKIRFEDIPAAQVVGDNQQVFDSLLANRDSVTLMSITSAERAIQQGVKVKLLALDGVAATGRNTSNGNYPLSRPLTFVTRDLPVGLASSFIEFALSVQANTIIEQAWIASSSMTG